MRNEDLTYFESKEFKGTLAHYEAAVNEGRPIYMDADELTDVAEYYMIKEREEEASQCIHTALELHPEATDPQVFLARQQLFHGHIEKAKELASVILDQQDREVRFLWAEIRIKEGRAQEASQQLMYYYRTLDEEKDLFLYDAAGVFMDYNEWEIALMWAEELKKKFPQFERADLLRSEIMVCYGRCQKAIPILDKILNENPFCAEAWSLMAEAQSGLEHYTEALEAIDYVLAIDETNLSAMLIRANSLFHLQRMKEAHEQYVKYLEKCPNDVSILYFDAVTLTNLECYHEALTQLGVALDYCHDDSPELSAIYIQTSYLMSKFNEAEHALTALEQAYSVNEKEKDTEYYLLKAHIYMENNIREDVEEYFDQAMRLAHDKNATRMTIAIEYAECEKYEKATALFEEILTDITCIIPDKEARCLPYLAYCTHFLKQYPKYKEYTQRAIQLNPQLTTFLFQHIYPENTLSKLEEGRLL